MRFTALPLICVSTASGAACWSGMEACQIAPAWKVNICVYAADGDSNLRTSGGHACAVWVDVDAGRTRETHHCVKCAHIADRGVSRVKDLEGQRVRDVPAFWGPPGERRATAPIQTRQTAAGNLASRGWSPLCTYRGYRAYIRHSATNTRLSQGTRQCPMLSVNAMASALDVTGLHAAAPAANAAAWGRAKPLM